MRILLVFILIIISKGGLLCQTQDSIKALLYRNMAWDASQKNYFKKCIRLIDSSIIYDGSKSWSFMIKAEAHWHIGEYEVAALSYKKGMTLDDDYLFVGANVLLGMLYDKAGKVKEAKEHYIFAIKIWEGGNLPTPKTFLVAEEEEYMVAIGLLGDSIKMKNKLTEFVLKNSHRQNLLALADKSRIQLLEVSFKKYTLPDNIDAKEEEEEK